MQNVIKLLESDDFLISIISTIIGVLLTFLLDKSKTTTSNSVVNNTSISINYYIDNKIINKPYDGLLGVFIFIFFIFYLFNPNYVHFLFNVLNKIIIFLCIGCLLYRVHKREYDYSWIAVIFIHLIFYFILDFAFDLISKNNSFTSISNYLNKKGILEFLSNYYRSPNLIIWITIYISGVLLLMLVLKEVVASMLLLSVNKFFNKKRVIWGFKKVSITLLLIFISYLCISGELYKLIIESGPKEIQNLLNYILYGQRG
ncbi:Uncharacterised protein [Mannheimia haemolytica]|uniref:Uncharacterized protein n=1 Tax=Mannheimia haemolytica TaxID=75985 RepID=A0A3S5F3P9_MANHA|nr:hypothetical protein [Mannheimia haemolytica]VEI78322.1 Uncharacterised protein [Mannheimia haemolytica]